jgi:hypothetical protein
VVNGHFYWYQEEWSNQTHSCLQQLTPTKARPHAKFTVTAGSGLTLNFDARGSGAPGDVAECAWQFNDAFGAQTIEKTTPKISHTFPSAGAPFTDGDRVASAAPPRPSPGDGPGRSPFCSSESFTLAKYRGRCARPCGLGRPRPG